MAEKKPHEAKVGKYAERPLKDAQMSQKDIEKAEDRPKVDQIEDYHQKHPTLKSNKAIDKAVAEQQEG